MWWRVGLLLLLLVNPAWAGSNERELVAFCKDPAGSIYEMQELLNRGADPDDNGSGAPLYWAAFNKRWDVTDLLLGHRADPTLLYKRQEDAVPAVQVAAEKGYDAIVDHLLDFGCPAGIVNSLGTPAWFFAVANGEELVLDQFIEHKVDLNQTSKEGEPALLIAASFGQSAMITKLIAAGADVNQTSADGLPVLVILAKSGALESSTALLDNGADPNVADKQGLTPLIAAAEGGHDELALLFMEHGAKVGAFDHRGLTAISVAEQQGHPELAKALQQADLMQRLTIIGAIMLGAIVFAGVIVWIIKRPPEGRPVDDPLEGHAFSADKQPERGSSRWSAREDAGRPLESNELSAALQRAIDKGHPAEVAKLLAQGADPEAISRDGVPVALLAVMTGNADLVSAFLRTGLDPNKSRPGTPLLFTAVEEGHTGVVRHLLQHQADANTPYHGVPPLVRAAEQGAKEIIAMLLKAGADIEGRMLEDPCRTALMQAALRGQTAAAKLLIDQGADREAVDAAGTNALQLAEKGGHRETINALKSERTVIDPDGPPQSRLF